MERHRAPPGDGNLSERNPELPYIPTCMLLMDAQFQISRDMYGHKAES